MGLQLHRSGVEYASLGPVPVGLEKDLRTGMMLKSGVNTASTVGAAEFDGQSPWGCLETSRFQVLSSYGRGGGGVIIHDF